MKIQEPVYNYLEDIKKELDRTFDVIGGVDRNQAEGRRNEKYFMLLNVLPSDSAESKRIMVDMLQKRIYERWNASAVVDDDDKDEGRVADG